MTMTLTFIASLIKISDLAAAGERKELVILCGMSGKGGQNWLSERFCDFV